MHDQGYCTFAPGGWLRQASVGEAARVCCFTLIILRNKKLAPEMVPKRPSHAINRRARIMMTVQVCQTSKGLYSASLTCFWTVSLGLSLRILATVGSKRNPAAS